ncbi:MAG: hypothetical protein AB1Z98_30455 [Nannocystaceae bacterium]
MKHAAYDDYDAQHLSVGAYDGGKCLHGHQSVYKVKDSCSYRWQGVRQAQDHPDPYTNYPAEYGTGFGVLGDDVSNIRSVSLSYANMLLGSRGGSTVGSAWVPKKNKGKKDPKKVIKFKPKGFTTGWSPWTNMVHHVLPNGVLIESVTGFAAGKSAIEVFIFRGLLNECYNNNYKINMIILPVRPKTARTVGLPTHARGDNHPVYSKKVKADVDAAVKKVYGELKSQMEQGQKKHKLPKHKKLKSALEDISNDHYAKIVKFGSGLRGSNRKYTDRTLDALAKACA